MSENLDWTQDLGDAFLAQKNDLMDTVQRMRGLAYEEGNLETTEQQTVTQQEDKIIIIESSSPEIIYVPTYVTELNQLTHTIATRVAPYHVIFEPLDFMFRTNGMPRAQEAQERPFPG